MIYWCPCLGCGMPVGESDAGNGPADPKPAPRLCSGCRAEHLEYLAHRIDPSYDPAAVHEWPGCLAVLRRVYCWPMLEE